MEKSWGKKRTCTCGKIRFYDLNKKEIECPGCGETIDVSFLSKMKINQNTFKNTYIKKPVEEKRVKDEKNDLEGETTIDAGETKKMPVEEIIGKTEGKKPTNIEDKEED